MPIPFCFDQASHICRTMDGRWIPTVSQVIKAQGLGFDFERFVEAEKLAMKSALGTEVHALIDAIDSHGDIDPTWESMDNAGYLESWRGFKRISGFITIDSSVRLVEEIDGMSVSGERDKFGMLGKYPAIIDIKTGSVKSDSWGLQTTAYELLKHRSRRSGRCIKAVAWLSPDGSPGKLVEYGDTSPIDGTRYDDTFVMGLHQVYWRMRRGYLSEKDFIKIE